jgi:hypothetical protein
MATKAPSETAVKTLFATSGNLCFFTGCEQLLTKPDWVKVNAKVAHIKGEHPGSARYDENQPDEERQGYHNLMLLCPMHHTLVDDLEPYNYSVAQLTDMKEKHLQSVANSSWSVGDAEALRLARIAIREWLIVEVGRQLLADQEGVQGTLEEPDTASGRGEANNAGIFTVGESPIGGVDVVGAANTRRENEANERHRRAAPSPHVAPPIVADDDAR